MLLSICTELHLELPELHAVLENRCQLTEKSPEHSADSQLIANHADDLRKADVDI
jgi:hypothetical protein